MGGGATLLPLPRAAEYRGYRQHVVIEPFREAIAPYRVAEP
jgi:hypothetical protein